MFSYFSKKFIFTTQTYFEKVVSTSSESPYDKTCFTPCVKERTQWLCFIDYKTVDKKWIRMLYKKSCMFQNV